LIKLIDTYKIIKYLILPKVKVKEVRMETKAAVASKAGAPLSIETVTV